MNAYEIIQLVLRRSACNFALHCISMIKGGKQAKRDKVAGETMMRSEEGHWQ
jgi:hypothetical protein